MKKAKEFFGNLIRFSFVALEKAIKFFIIVSPVLIWYLYDFQNYGANILTLFPLALYLFILFTVFC